MKKLFLILVVIFIRCSTPEETIDTSNDCDCGEIISAVYLTLPSGEFVTTLKVKNNCTNNIATIGLSGHVGVVGEQYCNN